MVKFNIFSSLVLLTLPYSLQGVLVKGAQWEMDQKEVLLFFDLHNEIQFVEHEKQELKTLVGSIKRYSQCAVILEKYFDVTVKPLHILIEEGPNPSSHEIIMGSLAKYLAQEEPLPFVFVENIEQRAASAAVRDLIRHFKPGFSTKFKVNNYRASSTQRFYYDLVTLQDLLDEYSLIDLYLHEAYEPSSEKVKKIHKEEVDIIKYYYDKILEEITINAIPLQETITSLLDRLVEVEVPSYFKILEKLIHTTFSCLLDLYTLHRILAIPQTSKIMLIAGADHSMYVQSEIMGRLGAKKAYGHGEYRRERAEITVITAEELSSLITV